MNPRRSVGIGWAICLIAIPVAAAGADPLPSDREVRYTMHETPSDPGSPVTFEVIFHLSAADRDNDFVAWDVEKIDFRQAGIDDACPRQWVAGAPVLQTLDGYWWIEHADPMEPEIAEFTVPPLVEGDADARNSEYPDLEYLVVGSEYTPPPGGPPYTVTAQMSYSFTLNGEEDPEDEDDDDPVDVDDPPDGPKGGCRHDLNMDTRVDAKDMQAFIGKILSAEYSIQVDLPLFVYTLLAGTGSPELGYEDCNSNSVYDAVDIAGATSDDCNANYIPDECDVENGMDINSNDIPDMCEADCNGNGIPDPYDMANGTSSDVNSNGVPDECDPDCNGNDIPDDRDIAQGTSADCDTNGVPDSCEPDCDTDGYPDVCEIAAGSAADCNTDGIPDACELANPFYGVHDCNTNGVLDQCDIASGTSQDCNNNGWPDACDFVTGVAKDCNSNTIPDSCDIAAATSEDCNTNAVPDSCDIAGPTSDDTDTNGIPDECDGMMLMGGGGGEQSMLFGGGAESMAGGAFFGDFGESGMDGGDEPAATSPEDEAAAWEAYYIWLAEEAPDPTTCDGATWFAAMVDKLRELGLPLCDPGYCGPSQ